MINDKEKVNELLADLKARNITLDDLRVKHNSSYEDEEEDVELLDDIYTSSEPDSDFVYEDAAESNNVELRENLNSEVDLGDFF